jgi:hypothetical protein
MVFAGLQIGSGMLESLSQVAVIAGTGLLVLMLVALGGFAYKSLSGDGITWPEDVDDDAGEEGQGLRKGDQDDEWDYY